jgi:hypothetical protein
MKEPRIIRTMPDLTGCRCIRVETGLGPREGAAVLHVYYPSDGNTYVFPQERMPKPYGYRGLQRVDCVLAWYVRAQSVRHLKES